MITRVLAICVVIILHVCSFVSEAHSPINVQVNNKQLHFKTTNLTTNTYDEFIDSYTAVYEFEENAYIDLVCISKYSRTRPFLYIYSVSGYKHNLENIPSVGAEVRMAGWLTADYENNVCIDCVSQPNSNSQIGRIVTYRVTFKLKQNADDTANKNHIIAYVNNKQLIHGRMDLKNNKLVYIYEFGYKETISVSCIRKYKTDEELAFSYKRAVKVAANAVTTNDVKPSDITILHHSSAKVNLEIIGSTLTTEQIVICRIKDKSWLQAEIILTPKSGTRQRVCTLPADSGRCKTYTIKWYFSVDYGACAQFYYGGCEGNDNQFSSEKECTNTCVTPKPQEACWLPNIEGPCKADELRWYFNTTMKQCMTFKYGGCLGNSNNFFSKELCESQCDSKKTVKTTIENIDKDFEKTTTSPDNITSEEKDVETGGSAVVVTCVAVIVAVIIGAVGVAFWYRRKKKIETTRNENTYHVYEDVNTTTPVPLVTFANDSSTPRYDYAYNINIDRLFITSGPPDPCRRVKPMQDNQQGQRRSSDDSSSTESNFYHEIDDYFINKREEKRKEKQKKKNLLKK